jgi:hypothetical protein
VFDVLQVYLHSIPVSFVVKKMTGDQNTKEKYNQLKHHTQKITRQSYWKYIENIFVIPFVVILNGFIV